MVVALAPPVALEVEILLVEVDNHSLVEVDNHSLVEADKDMPLEVA